MNKVLSTKTFIISQIVIFLLGLAFFLGLFYFLNPDFLSRNDWRNRGPVTRSPSKFILEVNSPLSEIVVFEASIVLSGKTSPNSLVLISQEGKDEVIQSDKKGEFLKVLELEEGLNQIIIFSFNKNGESKKEERLVYYSKEKL